MTTFRQSLLSSFEQCPRRAMHGMAIDDDLTVGNVGSSADLGSAFHAFAAEYLRTLHRQGEEQMPTQEAVEVLYEVLRAGPWVLPTQDRHDLRWLVLGFCRYKWRPTDFIAIERRLSTDVACPDGEVRALTGQPDLLIADAPDGVIICDWKSGRGQPRSPRNSRDDELVTGKQYLSERGHFQLDIYGFLTMRNYPSVNRAILRELHLRSGKIREATLGREELEHVERQIAEQMTKLDEAVTAGGEGHPLWRPRPGSWCARACPVAASCPIPAEQRGVGALDSEEAADAAAGRYVNVDGLRNTLRDQLKARYEQTGRPSFVGDGTAVFWRDKPDGSGRRDFGVWPVEDIPAPDDTDYEALLAKSVAQAEAERRGS
jgi:hypothetical protein